MDGNMHEELNSANVIKDRNYSYFVAYESILISCRILSYCCCCWLPIIFCCTFDLIKRLDEDKRGCMDTNSNRRTYPQGFRWTCCFERGADSMGCCDGYGKNINELFR